VLEKGQLSENAVVVLDEAGQVGTLDFEKLVKMVKQANGRLILSGDSKQHGAVCAGDILRLLETHSGCDIARIKTIRRQKEELYKSAVAKLSKHQSLEAWDMLDHSGKIEEQEGDERRHALAQWVENGITEGKNMLTVAPTWKEIDHVTNAIRDQLISTGHLGGEEKKVMVSERIDFTNSQKKQVRCYAVGMEIIERRGLNLHKKRMRIKEIHEDTLLLTDDQEHEQLLDLSKVSKKASWTVHRPRELEIRVGERLLLQANDRNHSYTNGDLVTVTGINGDTIQLSNGKQIGQDYTQFTYGWAVTSYASQGLTCDRVAVSYDQSSYSGIDRRGFYVASSRAKEDLRIFVDDKDFVRDCLRRNTGERETASEFVSQMLPEQLQQRLLWQRLLNQQNKEIIKKQETQEIKMQPDTLALEP
jgi:ATP-dependent exoDNAse (exonuclease V) alpha subunit